MSKRLTDADKAIRAITERQWQGTVEKLLEVHGWHWYHPSDNRPITGKSGKKYVQNVRAGFPDLIATKGTRLLAVELKREVGKTKPEQDAWLARLAATGAETFVWRPSDVGEVVTTLARNTH